MSFVTTPDGVRLHAEVLGSGSQTLIIPNAVHMQHDFARLANGRRVIFYDVRNRGLSDAPGSGSIQQDVDDLEALRAHFGVDRVALLGHSYLAFMVTLYAAKYPAHVSGVVQIGAPPPDPSKQYAPHPDPARDAIMAKIAQLPNSESPWPLARQLFAVNAAKIHWPTGVENETPAKLMPYLGTYVFPSIAAARVDFSTVTMPVLTIHGRLDRHAPYAGAVDWVEQLPNAQLVTVEDAAHYAWIDDPEGVFGAIEEFLGGL